MSSPEDNEPNSIEHFSEISVESLSEDITLWLGGIAAFSATGDRASLHIAQFSSIGRMNPFYRGQVLPSGRSAYGIPPIFRINVIPIGDSEHTHVRQIDEDLVNVSQLVTDSAKTYDFDVHGPQYYDNKHPFEGGDYIKVEQAETEVEEGNELIVKVEAPAVATHPVVGLSNDIKDAIHIPIRRIEEVKFQAVQIERTIIAERPQL